MEEKYGYDIWGSVRICKKTSSTKGGIDFRPDFRWLGVGYNIEAFIWNKRHPDDPVPYIPELDEEGLKELEKEVNSL